MKAIFEKAGIFLYAAKPGVELFELDHDTIIATTPLVMTQTLHKTTKHFTAESTKNQIKYLMCRNEAKRFLSAYNKKIAGRQQFDIDKYFLLASSGLNNVCNFIEMIKVLISRKNNGKFIDRHFIPQEYLVAKSKISYQYKLDIDDPKSAELLPTIFNTKVKSSYDMRYSNFTRKEELTPDEIVILKKYISLWGVKY